jgi:hypothetical protein
MKYILKHENLGVYFSNEDRYSHLYCLCPLLDTCTKFPNLVAAVRAKRKWEAEFAEKYGNFEVYKFSLKKVKT